MIRQIKNFLKLESSGGILLFTAAIFANPSGVEGWGFCD